MRRGWMTFTIGVAIGAAIGVMVLDVPVLAAIVLAAGLSASNAAGRWWR